MKKLFAIAALLTSLAVANAQLIESFSGGDPLSLGPGMAGFEFTVGATPLTIQTLGIFDEFSDGVLSLPHNIGIWNVSGQTLVAQATVVPATATEIGGFFWQNLSAPVTLAAGSTFRIAAQYADIDFDLARGNVPRANIFVDNDITLKDAYLSSSSGFGYPDLNVSGANYGFFGANAGFEAVPEPATYALFTGLALLGFSVYRRYAKA